MILGVMYFCVLAGVLALLLWPVEQKERLFDEKGEAIQVYRDEVAYIKLQYAKGLVDADDKQLLLAELDKKSALAIRAIENKTFSYRRSRISSFFIVFVLSVASLSYYHYYQRSGVMAWQAFNNNYHGLLTSALQDTLSIEKFAAKHDEEVNAMYCFAMQRELLRSYTENSDAYERVARCHLRRGFTNLSVQIIENGLKVDAAHNDLNYLMAEIDYLDDSVLSRASLVRLAAVLQRDPEHVNSVSLMAIHSLRVGDYRQARYFFEALKKHAEDNPELMRMLQSLDAEVPQ